MDAYITTPKMSEVLWEEFMEPMGISAYKLAKAIHVPTSRIQDILHELTHRCGWRNISVYLTTTS